MPKQAPKPPSVPEEIVGAADFKARCLELLDRVHDGGKPIVVTKRGIPVARVVPITPAGKALRGSMRDAFEIVGDIVEVDWSDEWEAGA